MQGRNRATLPGSTNNGLASCLSGPAGQRNSSLLASGAKFRAGLRRPTGPGQLLGLSSFRALNPSSELASTSSSSSGPAVKKDGEGNGHGSSNAAIRSTRQAYKLSDDPLLRQSQMLLEASRRLREQSMAPTNVDQRPGCSSTTYYAQPTQPKPSAAPDTQRSQTSISSSSSSSSLPSQLPTAVEPSASAAAVDPLASFGSLAAATANAAARLTAASAAPRALAATAAVTAAGAAVAPGAAQASAASVALTAMSAASSGWLAIEELLEEAAYSLSQELPGGRAISPLDTLLASASASTSASSMSASPAALIAAANGLPLATPGVGDLGLASLSSTSAVAALPAALSAAGGGGGGGALVGPGMATPAAFSVPGGVLSAVPGADRLSEMLDDMLYSLSQDINLSSAGEVVASAAAGLAGAAAEIPKAAAAVYRSAADAASAAAAARLAARGHVGSSSGYTLPEGVVPEPPSDPAWDPFGTIRAARLGIEPVLPAQFDDEVLVAEAAVETPAAAVEPLAAAVSNATAAADVAASSAPAAASASAAVKVAEAAAAAAAPAAAPAPPVVVASAAPSVADAATATAESVVQAATTAAAGTIVLPAPPVAPPPPPVAPFILPPPVPVAPPAPAPVPAPAAAAAAAAAPPAPAMPQACVLPGAAVPSTPPVVVPAPNGSSSGIGGSVPAPAASTPVPAPAAAAPPPVPAPAAAAPAPVPAPAPAPAPAAPPPAPEALPTVPQATITAPPPAPQPSAAVGPQAPAPSAAVVDSSIGGSGDGGAVYDDVFGAYDMDGLGMEDGQQLDQLTAALQSLLAVQDAAGADGAAGSLDAAAAIASAAAAAGPLPPAAEAAVTTLSEALRRELGAVVGSDAVDADPTALAQAAGQAVGSALSSLDLTALPADVRLTTLLGATLQSSLDLVESALGGMRSADSALVGGITIAAVLAVLLRAVVSMAGTAINRGRDAALMGAAAGQAAGDEAGSPSRARVIGSCALDAAAALNNDPLALLVDIRNGSDVQDQGLPDLRPFRRGAGAAVVSLPYCDFRTAPTLANPSGLLSGPPASAAMALLSPAAAAAGKVTVSVDPQFVARFKKVAGLNRDSRVFLLDSYGVESPEAVGLLRSDPELERLLGSQIKFVEGGFAGPEGWKLTGLPVADPPKGEQSSATPTSSRGLDLTGLLSGVAGLRVRYPFLFSRGLAVGAAGAGGVAVASTLDWGAVSRGAVGLAAAMLLADRALPTGVRPSGKIRKYLEAQLSEPQPGDANQDEVASRRRRTALLLRALDLAETVGDAVVRAGGAALTYAGSAARSAMASSGGAPAATVPAALAPPAAAAPTAATVPSTEPSAAEATAADTDTAAAVRSAVGAADPMNIESQLETPPPAAAGRGAATIVLPHGMDSPQWSAATEEAAAVQKTRSSSPIRTNGPLAGAKPAAAANDQLLPPRAQSPSLAGRLGTALRTAADAVVRAASPSRSGSGSSAAAAAGLAAAGPRPAPRAPSPGASGGSKGPDTLELMAALATASALSSTNLSGGGDGGLLPPGWPAVNFPRASAGQGTVPERDGVEQQQPPMTTAAGEAVKPAWRRDAEEEEAHEMPSVRAFEKAAEKDQDQAEEDEEASAAAPAVSSPSTSAWATWRQELDVAPPPPAIEGIRWRLQDGAGIDPTSIDRIAAAAADVSSVPNVVSRQELSPRQQHHHRSGMPSSNAGSNDDELSAGGGDDGRRERRQPLRPSSLERADADAAAAAMRMLRMDISNRDDDGLGVGIYGGGDFFGGSSFDESSDVEEEEEEAPALAAAAVAAVPAVRGGRGGRSGSAGVAAARMARNGGLSPGAERQHRVSVRVSQRRPLRTASPERAAAAAAAMRQLRLEMGLPPNDGKEWAGAASSAAAVAAPMAVAPRDWRRELEAAAEAPGNSGGGGGHGPARVSPAAAAASVPVSRSPRNWRAQLEGRAGGSAAAAAPADWRMQMEDGGSSGGAGGNGGRVAVLQKSTSPSRTKLTASERAERDARLQDWRARV